MVMISSMFHTEDHLAIATKCWIGGSMHKIILASCAL
jgi:hypothetical protein